jgi:tripartite-type tricarboxylate transporter receptor subunit TctC
MFKILISLLFVVSGVAAADPIPVTVVWPSDIGGTQANRVRLMVQQANAIQNKYQFFFENRPGGGGSVGARYMLTNRGINVMVWTSSWFVRPIFYPTESYNLNDFKPVSIQCTNFPYVMLSKKYQSYADLKKQKRITIGTIGGSAAESLVHELRRQLPNTDVTFVPYNNMTRPRLDVVGDVLDVNIDLPSDSLQWVENGTLNVIGGSGPSSHGPFRSFRSQGITGYEDLASNFFIIAPNSLDKKTTSELHDVFANADADPQMIKMFNDDFCRPVNLDEEQTNTLYARWVKFWPTVLKKQ